MPLQFETDRTLFSPDAVDAGTLAMLSEAVSYTHLQKEETLDRKTEQVEHKTEQLTKKLAEAEKVNARAEETLKKQWEKLEEISGFTVEQAKEDVYKRQWLVGSSRIRRSGRWSSSFAIARRVFAPPERAQTGVSIVCSGKPIPFATVRTRTSISYPPRASKRGSSRAYSRLASASVIRWERSVRRACIASSSEKTERSSEATVPALSHPLFCAR